MQIIVYTETITPRIRYIFSHLLTNMLGLEVVFSQDINDISAYQGPSINYSTRKVDGSITITPHSLLTHKGVEQQSFAIFSWRGIPAFFPTNDSADIPFDLFAASFYLISRYEEYLPHQKDVHGRFDVYQSIAYKSGFLEIPIVDLWVKELHSIIQQKFTSIDFQLHNFNFIPTIDIDNAYAYRHKGFTRAFLGTSRSIVRFNLYDFYSRIAVYLRLQRDPFNTYRKIFRILSQHHQSVWFILGGRYGEFDKSIPLHKKPIKRLLKHIANQFRVGIHPSYASNSSLSIISNEIQALSNASGTLIDLSRQHFLRIKFPDTYRILNELGIKYDFSIGYSNAVGFRASTSTPFKFYDILEEKELEITLAPFQVMDRALLDGLGLTPQKAVEKTIELAQQVKDVNGTFVLAWHNESLSGINEWKGWENVLKEIVEGIKR